MSDKPLIIKVMTPLSFTVHCSADYWQRKIITDHPPMRDRIDEVEQTLANPEEVRLSRSDRGVYLFYKSDEKRLVCAVARRLNGDGYLITVYPTDVMKRGETVWKR